MRKRLQVSLDEQELLEIRQAAGRSGLTVSARARQVMREASERERARKLDVIREAAKHSFPAADLDTTMAEIEATR
jgi:hypothetical protein